MENFVRRFEYVVGKTPDKIALVCGDDRLTYHQLDELSSKIAARLIRNGAEKEKIYPIVLRRSNLYIGAIIGVLKSGAAYSPLSAAYPKDRVEYIKKDSGADLIIDDDFLDGCRRLCPRYLCRTRRSLSTPRVQREIPRASYTTIFRLQALL